MTLPRAPLSVRLALALVRAFSLLVPARHTIGRRTGFPVTKRHFRLTGHRRPFLPVGDRSLDLE